MRQTARPNPFQRWVVSAVAAKIVIWCVHCGQPSNRKGAMVKFFIPGAEDSEESERMYSAAKKLVGEEMGADIDERKFYSLHYRHNGKEYIDRVGEYQSSIGEVVVCILRDRIRDLYFVCTLNRGVACEMPVLVGANEIIAIDEFEDE